MKKTDKKILICGAGIAGPTCAYWLHEYGYSVVIAEKADVLRDGGQNVDIKGAAQQILAMMGIVKKVEAKDTLEKGLKYLDANGKVVAVYPKGGFACLTAEFEILRGDFAQIMYETTKDRCEFRFGTFVTGLEETDDGMTVTFNDGRVEDFEMVICAEGVSSQTRAMVMADHIKYRYLGVYMSFFKIPRRPEDDKWAWVVNGSGGTLLSLRPGDDKETTVLTSFPRKNGGAWGDDAATRRALLTGALKGRGTIADRVLSELDSTTDFYFGPMSQVRASKWSKGRFVIVGDAAYAPTPFTGQGTALGMVGAYVLAGEIKRSVDHAEAFSTYESLVRPYVEASQDRLSPRLIRAMHIKSRVGLSILRLVEKFFANGTIQRLLTPSEAKREKDSEDFIFANYS